MNPRNHTPPSDRPVPPLDLLAAPDDPAWTVTFHSTTGPRRGWFLVRARDRLDARALADYQLSGDEVLDEVFFGVHFAEARDRGR